MNFNKNDLRQVNEEYIDSLNESGDLALFTSRAIQDLKELWERMDQNPENSSRPSGSMPPWGRGSGNDKDSQEQQSENGDVSKNDFIEPTDAESSDDVNMSDNPAGAEDTKVELKPKRKPGRQHGAKGYSRTEILPIDCVMDHRPEYCKGCTKLLDEKSLSTAIGGCYQLDIQYDTENDKPGIHTIHTKHIHYECICPHCGFKTQYSPYFEESNKDWTVRISEMHFVGPRLMALIIYLSFSMRLSRKKVQQFLLDWLKVTLSTSTINQCIHEAGRIVEPLEEELIMDVRKAHQNYVDETPWWERARKNMYMWVFVSLYTCYFFIGRRTKDVVTDILPLDFEGQLMSDGYSVYREFKNRGRCWDHLRRKARGLSESLDSDVQEFGEKTLKTFEKLMNAIYKARERRPEKNLKEMFKEELIFLKYNCVKYDDHFHDKTRALARELLYDWDAIFAVLGNPHLPMTNNEAERALRHWVIYRRICLGTQSQQGSKTVSILASVIETCKRRQVTYWDFITEAIRERRFGKLLPSLPSIPISEAAVNAA